MKKALIIMVAIATIGSSQILAQNSKIGHINSNDLLELMPEKAKAAQDVEAFAKQLESQLKTMSAEYQNKVTEYQNQQALMAEAVKQAKVQEITDLETRIQQFQQNAQASLQQKENEILQPIIQKAKKAIEDVAKEKGFDYILDTGLGVVLYWETGEDILPLVKKKLAL
jgi:outer membrane protein